MRESPHRTNHALSGVGFNKTERKEYFMAEKQSNKERIKEITAELKKVSRNFLNLTVTGIT